MSPEAQPILDILKRRGILSGTSYRTVQGFMNKWSIDAFHAVIETHVIDESRFADILAEEFRLPRLSRLPRLKFHKEAIAFLEYDRAMAWQMLPFRFGDDGTLHVLIADPTKQHAIDYIKANSGKTVALFIAEHNEIEVATQRNYPLTMQLPSTMEGCIARTMHP